MITAIELKNLRGVREGRVADLAPLTFLVGPSGAGKSTVLDAALIAASGTPEDAVGRVIVRRAELAEGGRWLFSGGSPRATINLEVDGSPVRTCELARRPQPSQELLQLLEDRRRNPVEIACDFGGLFGSASSRTLVAEGGTYFGDLRGPNPDAVAVFRNALRARLVEPAAGSNHSSISSAYSRAVEQGAARAIDEIVREVLPGTVGLRILSYEDDGRELPALHIEFEDQTVPVAAAGSGVYALLRLAIDLAAQREGVALVEEPEIHQHPRSLSLSAGVLLAAARRGLQVLVSTHSLDLIDAVLARADDSDLGKLAVIRVALDGGKLRTSNLSGPMVVTARHTMNEDFR